MKCIAYHERTGVRCHRRPSVQRRLKDLKVCREHGRSILITIQADANGPTRCEALARASWTHINQVPQ